MTTKKAVKAVVIPALTQCAGCGRKMIHLQNSDSDNPVINLYEDVAEEMSEAFFKAQGLVLLYDDNFCAKCHNNPSEREYFSCPFCLQSVPIADMRVLISDEDCCNADEHTLRICEKCASTVTITQLAVKLDEKDMIIASADLDSMDSLYFAANVPVAKRRRSKSR